jgi:hypothetical protein
MTLRTQYQFEVPGHLPVRWKARSWRPRITRLSPLFRSESSPNCRRPRRTLEVVCVWRRFSKPPVRTGPWASRYTHHSFFP